MDRINANFPFIKTTELINLLYTPERWEELKTTRRNFCPEKFAQEFKTSLETGTFKDDVTEIKEHRCPNPEGRQAFLEAIRKELPKMDKATKKCEKDLRKLLQKSIKKNRKLKK